MIRFERTRNYEQVAEIMTHPRIYAWIADDFYPSPENFTPHQGENIWYLLAFDGEELLGLYITHPINAVLWEAHIALLPNAWGPRAIELAEAFLGFLWEYTAAEKLVGLIPSCNTLALRYTRRFMREAGRLSRCYVRFGQLHDLIIFEKSRTS